MNFLVKILFPIIASAIIILSQALSSLQDIFTLPTPIPATETEGTFTDLPAAVETLQTPPTVATTAPAFESSESTTVQFEEPAIIHPFANPAGCAISNPNLTPEQMLANVQNAIGSEYNLAERRQTYIWNGEQGSMINVTTDPFVYEFTFNEFQHPLTYRGDKVATIFLTQGFAVWFREYSDNFRLLAIPMTNGVTESIWASYVTTYWQKDGIPNDEKIYPVMKKLPCHWVIDAGYVTDETLSTMFNLDWHIPDYLSAGRQYLAGTCKDAYKVSNEKIGYWDATSMCGPLAWTIMRDVNAFPYRMGSWSQNAGAFTRVNPRWSGQPWGSFDPETFTLFSTQEHIAGYDFAANGDLYTGDIVYTFATLYVTPGYFDHIFVVAGIDENNTRVTVSNMVRNSPYADCSIEEVKLYTPGDRETGALNYEWNGNGFGKTGTTGFDVFRWNWITYHKNGQSMQYTVRWGETIETIAFDWKVSPESILEANQFNSDVQLTPGQIITLPTPLDSTY
ncbi:MAG: LysM peptidoglycan-binding domain-containing protein [Anaerolineae bacterium]|nr:LysM peptidoglycan-binding domain-containing protein [Anaerolineae bacterium]